MDSRQCWTATRRLGTVAVDAGLSRWNRGMRRFVNRVVTVTAVHLQLASVQRVAKGNGLLWSVAGVQSNRTGRAEEQHAGVSPAACNQHAEQSQELIGPPWEQESLHGHTVSFL